MILLPTSSLQQEWRNKNPSQVAKPRVMDFFSASTARERVGSKIITTRLLWERVGGNIITTRLLMQ